MYDTDGLREIKKGKHFILIIFYTVKKFNNTKILYIRKI